jgi:hypothetical protein
MAKQLKLNRGDAKPVRFKLYKKDTNKKRVPYDLTGGTFQFGVKEHLNETAETPPFFVNDCTIVGSATDGELQCMVSETDTDHVGNFIGQIKGTWSGAGVKITIAELPVVIREVVIDS